MKGNASRYARINGVGLMPPVSFFIFFLSLVIVMTGCQAGRGLVADDSSTLKDLQRREKYLNSANKIIASKVFLVLPRALRDEVAISGDKSLPVQIKGERILQKVMGRAKLLLRELEVLADESIEVLYEEGTLVAGRVYILAEGHVSHINDQRAIRNMKTLEIENDTLHYTGRPEIEKHKSAPLSEKGKK